MMSLKIGKKPRREEDGYSTGMELVAGNDDLLTLILLRLPVKSLLRFQSVSKQWLSLISDPQFRNLKSRRCCKHTSGIILKPHKLGDNEFKFVPLDQDDRPAPFESLDFVGADTRLDIIEYCNGLLLCRSKRELSTETKCYIINPTTKQHTTVLLPVKDSAGKRLELYSVALAFDPRKSPNFKLICLFRDFGGYELPDYCVRIYSSETGLMTQLSDMFHTSSDFLLSCGFYWNGAINWFDFSNDGMYFNVDEERFGIIPMPPEPQDNYGRVNYYGESNDHLLLAQTNTTPATHLAVYEMDREYSGWFVRFRVDLRPMFRAFPTAPTISERLPESFSILAIVDKDDGENSFIVFGRPGKAIRFNVKDRVFTKICDFYDEGYLPLWAQSIQFTESLHPL